MLPELPKSEIIEMYRRMLLIRRFEEAVVLHNAEIPQHYHVYIGQEATAVGASAVLKSEDYLCTTHRNHGHLLARGADPKRLMAEIYGKSTGTNRGYGGSMHMTVADLGFLAASAMVGGSIPVATGAGLAGKVRGARQVAVAWFGEGAVNEGAFYEAINMACLWRLPVVYICENNDAKDMTLMNANDRMGTREIARIPAAFNMDVYVVDGADLGLVYKTVHSAVERARDGGGPTFIEARTYPWPGASANPRVLPGGETDLSTATRMRPWGEGVDPWHFLHDPITHCTGELIAGGVMNVKEVFDMDSEVKKTVEEAVDFARTSPLPRPEQALEGVFVNISGRQR